MIVFNFDFLPISVNELFVNIRGQSRRFLSKKGKEFKQKVKTYCEQQIQVSSLDISKIRDKRLKVIINVHTKTWLLKDGVTPRISDISNREKALTDSVFEVLGIGDHWIWTVELNKCDRSEEEKTEYIIEVIDLI